MPGQPMTTLRVCRQTIKVSPGAVDSIVGYTHPSTMTATLPRYPEERRLATVMFADIEGFTALAALLDIEEVSDLIRDIWQRVDAIIEKHDGYIDKHIGDAVMAVWGAPLAHE